MEYGFRLCGPYGMERDLWEGERGVGARRKCGVEEGVSECMGSLWYGKHQV